MWGIIQRFRRAGTYPLTKPPHLDLGERGERVAAQFLLEQGYRIVATNFIAPIGYSRDGRQITAEIDIIAYDESSAPFYLAFVEVKTRTSSDIATPESAVDVRKRRQIARAAGVYRRLIAVEAEPYRYDVVSIVIESVEKTRISLLRGYFTDRRFERSNWMRDKI
ncbi:MAG: YraN family protein [Acidobacteria bacterium]|nr:YraN family protein [Acidobacteriota bacterium]